MAPVLQYLMGASPTWVILAGAAAIAVLADWVRRATERVAAKAGPAIGGLLNISFGSLAELILALLVLADDKPDVVRAQITGSIMGTSLFGLGWRTWWAASGASISSSSASAPACCRACWCSMAPIWSTRW